MAAEILPFNAAANQNSDPKRHPQMFDQFLFDEGLDLLAAYRSISDQALRFRLKKLVQLVANDPNAPWLTRIAVDWE